MALDKRVRAARRRVKDFDKRLARAKSFKDPDKRMVAVHKIMSNKVNDLNWAHAVKLPKGFKW